ncbi:MAG: rod shape-determining protein [Bacteroidales bacterium]|nr:rod shape-determining protein [Bacteroidales bacterium]
MLRAIRDFASSVGVSITVLSHGKLALNKYMASAIRNGIDVRTPETCMVVNIGMYTTDIAIISNGRLLSFRSTSTSYDTFLNDIIVYMSRMHNVRIDEPIGKKVLSAVGSAISELENAPEPYIVLAPNRVTALPMRIPVSYQEISHCLSRNIESLIRFIERVYVLLPLDIQGAIFRRGVFLTGEGACMRGLAKRIESSLCIPCHAVCKKTLTPS